LSKHEGDKNKEIVELINLSPAFRKAQEDINSKFGRKVFAYGFLRFWNFVQTEGKQKFDWLKAVNSRRFDKAL
jgi:hypothetical protein